MNPRFGPMIRYKSSMISSNGLFHRLVDIRLNYLSVNILVIYIDLKVPNHTSFQREWYL